MFYLLYILIFLALIVAVVGAVRIIAYYFEMDDEE